MVGWRRTAVIRLESGGHTNIFKKKNPEFSRFICGTNIGR
jgi:hypothetical protein